MIGGETKFAERFMDSSDLIASRSSVISGSQKDIALLRVVINVNRRRLWVCSVISLNMYFVASIHSGKCIDSSYNESWINKIAISLRKEHISCTFPLKYGSGGPRLARSSFLTLGARADTGRFRKTSLEIDDERPFKSNSEKARYFIRRA